METRVHSVRSMGKDRALEVTAGVEWVESQVRAAAGLNCVLRHSHCCRRPVQIDDVIKPSEFA